MQKGAGPFELLVDLSVIAMHDAGTGIQRVVRAVYAQLERLASAGYSVRPVAANATCDYRYLPSTFPAQPLTIPLEDCPRVSPAPGCVFLGLDLTSAIMPRHEAQIATWRKSGVTIHIWLYDLLPLLHGAWFRRRTRRHFRRWLGVIERHADQIICNSDTVRRQFERWNGRFWRPHGRHTVAVRTIPLSGDLAASLPSQGIPQDSERVLNWMAQRPTVLIIGTVEPRKGYDQVVAAFEMLWRERGDGAPSLFVIGRPGWKTLRIQQKMRRLSSFEGHFLWRDDISDEFMEVLFTRASGVLFASRGEGFGLPVVEAQNHGIPILVRELPELAGILSPATKTFSGNSPRALAQAIKAWLATPIPDRSTLEPGKARSWSDVAMEVLDALGIVPPMHWQRVEKASQFLASTDGDA